MIWIIVDVLMAVFGIYLIVTWFDMKKTGKVNQRLLMRNGLLGRPCRDKQGYFDAVFRPTLICGMTSVAAGIISAVCSLLGTGNYVSLIMTLLFLAASLYYSKKVSDATKKYYL